MRECKDGNGVSAELVDDNFTHWKGQMQRMQRRAQCMICGVMLILVSSAFFSLSSPAGTVLGPSGTPYEGGVFLVDILIPVNYPFEPPKMRFDTKVWHPNVSSQNGAICLDILKNEWSVERERKKAKK